MSEIKFPVNSKVKFPKNYTRGPLELRNAEWRVIEVVSPGYGYWVHCENSSHHRVNSSKEDYIYHCTFYSNKRKHALHRWVYDNELVSA